MTPDLLRDWLLAELRRLSEPIDADLDALVAVGKLERLSARRYRALVMRLRHLLSALEKKHENERLRPLRVIMVMEGLGTRQAIEALEGFGKLEPDTRVGQEARAAAQRLSKRLSERP
jgi:hypothetical protein